MTIRKPLSSLKNTQNITQTFVPLQKSQFEQQKNSESPKKVTILENKIQELHQQSFNDTNFICELEDHVQTLENKNEKLNNELNEIKQYLGNNWKSSLCEFTLLDDLRKIDENSPLNTNQKDLQLQKLFNEVPRLGKRTKKVAKKNKRNNKKKEVLKNKNVQPKATAHKADPQDTIQKTLKLEEEITHIISNVIHILKNNQNSPTNK